MINTSTSSCWTWAEGRRRVSCSALRVVPRPCLGDTWRTVVACLKQQSLLLNMRFSVKRWPELQLIVANAQDNVIVRYSYKIITRNDISTRTRMIIELSTRPRLLEGIDWNPFEIAFLVREFNCLSQFYPVRYLPTYFCPH